MPNNAKIGILGNLTRDPAVRQVKTNNVVSFSVAVNTMARKDDGTYESNFYDVSVWGKQGEYLMQHLQKGTQVWVTGDFEAGTYNDKDGNLRVALRITANDVRVLARAKGETSDAPSPRHDARPQRNDELPF